MPSNRRKQINPTKSVHNIEPDDKAEKDKAGPSSGSRPSRLPEGKEVDYREVTLKFGQRRGVGYFIKNFVFIKNRESHGKIFLRCRQRSTCGARAYIIKGKSKRAIVTQAYHPHPPPNHMTIEFKTPPPTKKVTSPAGKRKSQRTSPRKAKRVNEDGPESEVEEGEEGPVEGTKESESNDELEAKPPLPVRERSQRKRKLPARLREDPSPIPFIGKRKKKKKVALILPPRQKKTKAKTTAVQPKKERIKLEVVESDVPSEGSNVDSESDSDNEVFDKKDLSDSSSLARSPSRSPARSPRQKRSPRKGSPGSSGSSPKVKDQKSALEVLRQLTYAALESEPEDDDEDDDDMVVSSDDDEVEKKPKVVEKKEPRQRTILDVDQLRKLSATALVLKFSKHTTSKVPKDANTFTYQHQYACTMLPGICSEKFCGNAVDTKPQIKRHLLRHIGELLTMTNQVSPATAFPGSVQSQAKRRMPTTEEIEEIEDLDSPGSATSETQENPEDNPDDENKESTSTTDDKTEEADDPSTPAKVKTISYQIPTSHQPNKAVTVSLPKEVDVRRSSFTVIRSAEGVNEVVLLPKGRLINLSAMQPNSDDDEEGKEEVKKAEDDKAAGDGEQKEGKKKKKFYYPNYNRLRKKGLSKTRAFHMRQSAVRLEIVDDFDEDIDIEDTGDDEETDSNASDDKDDNGEGREEKGASQEEHIETEEVSLAGAFQTPDTDSPARHRSGIVPSTSQKIECDIVVRTRKHPANKKPTLPRSVGQSLKSTRELNKVWHTDETKPRNIAMDPPGDDHNYAWHPTRYISGPTHTDSRGNPLTKPEEKDDTEEKYDLDHIFYPFQPGGSSQKKSKQRRPLTKTVPGVGKVVSHTVKAGNPRWAKGLARDKREMTDEEKKMKKKALELLNALHKKQAFKGRKGPFKCQLCGKNVTAAGTLRAHYRSHAGIKPYRCKLCQATFTRLHSLKYHMMIHNQQSRFVCDHCSREFRHASHFREHLRRHTGEEPFGCTDCPARFKTRNTYKRHLFAKHGKLLTADGIQLVPHEHT